MQNLLKSRVNLILFATLVLVLIGVVWGVRGFRERQAQTREAEEKELVFDAEGPYGLLIPRRDGNALILNLKRTASYDGISYELAYNAEGIDRGVVGNVDTSQKKGEYEQEILFGTCSKNVCKYDKGVENGTLTLHIRAGREKYKMVTLWHLQKVDVSLGQIISGDDHFIYKTSSVDPGELNTTGYTLTSELTGVPKLPVDKKTFGKVYAINIPSAKILGKGNVVLELKDSPPQDAKLARFEEIKNEWEILDSKVGDGKIKADSNGAGIYAVLVSSK